MPTFSLCRRSRGVSASFAAALLIFANHPAQANTGHSGGDVDVDEMIVSAARVPTEQNRVNVPVETLTRDEIIRRQAVVLADLLTGSPGVGLTRSGGSGALTELRMRGAEAGHVLVTIDGIDANDPALGSTVDLAHIDLSGVERVEVLRGPQSALWGSDALAGVINIATASRPTAPSGRLSVESGSFSTRSLQGGLNSGNGRVYGSVNASLFNTDGINISETGTGRDGYWNRTLQASGGIDDEGYELSAVLRQTDAESEYDPVPFATPEDGDREFHTRQRYGRISGTTGLTPATRQTLALAVSDTSNENFADGESTNTNQGRRTRLTLQNDWAFGTWDADSRISIALERQIEDFRQRAPVTAFGDPNQNQSIRSSSISVEYDVAVSEEFGLTLSARGDRNSEFDDVVALRAAARYHVAQSGTRVFASAGTGVNNPTFTERFGFTPDTFVGNPELKPERSIGLQLALEQPVGERFVAEIALFRDWLIDEIDGFVFDPDSGAFTADNRDGRSHRHGVELRTRFDLTDALRLSAGYGYLTATEPAADGRQTRELRRPRHTGNLATDFTSADGRLQLRLGGAYVGETLDNDFSTIPATQVTLDDYWLVHLTGRYHLNDTWSLFGRVENALDTDYQTVLGYNTPGRSGYIGITAAL